MSDVISTPHIPIIESPELPAPTQAHPTNLASLERMIELVTATPAPQQQETLLQCETPFKIENLFDVDLKPRNEKLVPERTLDQCRDIVYEAASGKENHPVKLVMECIVQLQSKLGNKDLNFYFLEAATQGGVRRGTGPLNPIRFGDHTDKRAGTFCTIAAMCMIANHPFLGSDVAELKNQCKAKFPYAGSKNFDQAIDTFPPEVYAEYQKFAESLGKKYGPYKNPLLQPNGLSKSTCEFIVRYHQAKHNATLAKALAIDIAKSFGQELFKMCPPSGTEMRRNNQSKILAILKRCGENAKPISLEDYDAQTIEAASYYFRFAMWTDLQASFKFVVVTDHKGVFTTESFDWARKEYATAKELGSSVNIVQWSLEISATFAKYVPLCCPPIAQASERFSLPQVDIHTFWLTNMANNHRIFPFDPKLPSPLFYIGPHDYRIASLLSSDSQSPNTLNRNTTHAPPKHMYFSEGGYDLALAALREKFPDAKIGRYVHGNTDWWGGNPWQSRAEVDKRLAEDEHTMSKCALYNDLVKLIAQSYCPLTACGVIVAEDVDFSNDRTGQDMWKETFAYMSAHRAFTHGDNSDVPMHELNPQGILLKEKLDSLANEKKNGWAKVKQMKIEKADPTEIHIMELTMKMMQEEEKKLKQKICLEITPRAREAYEEEIYGKMLTFFGSQIIAGTDVLIMGMIGMGAFGNDPEPMVEGMKKALQTLLNSSNEQTKERLSKMTIVWLVDPRSADSNTKRFSAAVEKMLKDLGHEFSGQIVSKTSFDIKAQ